MTLPKDVAEAVALGDQFADTYKHGFAVKNAWDVIRAHLLSQDAEIVQLARKNNLLLIAAKLAESRLAAAGAQLDIKDWDVRRSPQLERGKRYFRSRLNCGFGSLHTRKEPAMKLRTEMVDPDSTCEHTYPAARVDDDGQDYLYDAAAAHALMQALDEWGEKPRTVDYVCVRWVRLRADELMRQWGFTDE